MTRAATAVLLSGCASTQQEKETDKAINEVQHTGSPLRKSLEKAAEHLPAGSSVEEQTAQAVKEAEIAKEEKDIERRPKLGVWRTLTAGNL